MTDVKQWLESLGLGEYAVAFEENAVTRDTLPALDHDLLKEIGVRAVGHRIVLLNAIQSLEPAPGTIAAGAAAAPSRDGLPQEAERRQLTVMFCDVVGSTALSGSMDPEDYRSILARYQTTVSSVIREHDGYIARYMGDGLLVYFGYPLAQETDPERAVLAASRLEIGKTFGGPGASHHRPSRGGEVAIAARLPGADSDRAPHSGSMVLLPVSTDHRQLPRNRAAQDRIASTRREATRDRRWHGGHAAGTGTRERSARAVALTPPLTTDPRPLSGAELRPRRAEASARLGADRAGGGNRKARADNVEGGGVRPMQVLDGE